MSTTKTEKIRIAAETDIVQVRHKVRSLALEVRFGLLDQTKFVTAASELARNTLIYGGGGDMTAEVHFGEDGKRGVRLVFEDQGPGIPDVALALKDGYTTGGGLGLGLSGARRLCDVFDIDSSVDGGTRVSIEMWR